MSNPWDESPIVSSANESEPWLSSPIVASPGKPKEEQSDAMAGLKTAFKQLPELGWGLGAITAAGIESMAGEGGIATAAKKFSVSKMQDWQASIAKDSRDVYDLDVAWDKAKGGDFGALVDWAQYGVGYAVGQGIQILGTAGAGKLITQAAIKPAVEKLAAGMVAKEAAKIGATEAGKAMAEDQIAKMAVANVAGKLGEQVALAGVAFGMEGGEIGGDLAERSVKENRALSGSELARGLGATLLAGSMEYGGDLISLGAMKGFKAGKLPFESTPGIAGKVGRAAVSTAMTAPVEGATEYFQTGAEEFGKGTEENLLPFNQSAENQRQALNAAGLGAIGGGAHAVLGAAISKPKPSDVLDAKDVDSAIAAADAVISEPLALPSYAGEPLVTFPDGTTMTRAEYEQRRLDGMVQPVAQPEPEKLGLPHYAGPTLVVGKDGSTMTGAEAEQRRIEQEQQRLDGMVQPADKPILSLPAPSAMVASESGEVGTAGQVQNAELEKRIKALEDANNGLTADVIAAQEARNKSSETPLFKGQKVTELSDDDLALHSTSPRVAMSVRNVLKQEIERRKASEPVQETTTTPATAGVSISASSNSPAPAPVEAKETPKAPVVEVKKQPPALDQGSAQRTATNLTRQGFPSKAVPHPTVPGKFAVVDAGQAATEQIAEPERQAEPVSEPVPSGVEDAAVANSESVVAQNQPNSAKAGNRKASPIMQRKDIVGAIMRVTGGKGISAELAQTLTGDKANNETRLRGLFSNSGIYDLSDIADRLREDEGFDVKDAAHLEELVREAAAGNRILSMQGQQQAMEDDQEKQHRQEIYRQADELGVKRVARKFSAVEAEVIQLLEQRQKKAEEEAGAGFAEAMKEAEALLSAEEIDSVADTVTPGGSAIAYYNEFKSKLRDDINAKASSERSEDGGLGGQPVGPQPHEETDRGEEFRLTGQTEAEAREEAERLSKPEAEPTKEQIDREATAPFALDGGSQAKTTGSAPVGGQGGLFTPDGRVSQQSQIEEQPAPSEFSPIEQKLAEKAHDTEDPGDVGIVVGGGKVQFVSLQDAVDAAREAIDSGTKAVPFQIHNATGIRLGDVGQILDALNAPAAPESEVSRTKKAPSVEKPEVETMMTDGTFKNWKRQGIPTLSPANGWTVFVDERGVPGLGKFVLMTPFNSVRFDSEQEARSWAKNNKAVKGDFNKKSETDESESETQSIESEVSKTKSALDSAGVTGKDRLETIAAVRRGELTADDVAESHKPIGDFGQKIGGARKDVWTAYKDKINEVTDDEIANQPLSKVWPEPDYQALLDAGVNQWAVAFIHAARDEIPTKPKKPYRVKQWVGQVSTLREMASKMLSGEYSPEQVKEKLQLTGGLRKLASRVELYELIGHQKSLAGISFAHHYYSLYRGRENVSLWVVEQEAKATAWSNWPQEISTGDTKEEALAGFKARYESLNTEKQKSKEVSFDIYSQTGTNGYFVGKKLGRNIAELAGPFTTIKEAREYRTNNQSELVSKLEKYKEIPKLRRDSNEPRVGEDMRDGQDVTPELFAESFGFKGVEFGNWVEQKKRQKDLNDAFDALMDMAAILGVPPKALSLNGQLGLAFGARGTGGIDPAAAHYEPDFVAINLTKKEGAGSLGHEWWYALDNYFARMRKQGDGMMTGALDVSLASRDAEYHHRGEVRKEMVDAFGAVVKAIKNTALKARSQKLDNRRSKEYWTTNAEMSARAFESYLITKLQDQNASNDYLANIVDEKTWKAAEGLGFELDDSYPYPTAGEVPVINAGFDHLFQTIQTKETDTGIDMFSRSGQRDQTETPAFKAWFGDSKVVDAEGKPLVVYHGTTKDFSEFNTNGYRDIGSHFGTKEQANDFSDFDDGIVIPAYLRIRNPFEMPDLNRWTFERLRDHLSTAGIAVQDVKREVVSHLAHENAINHYSRQFEAIKSALEVAGYDGISYINQHEGDGGLSYIAFRPEQIKSAIGNNGDFSPNDPNILLSRLTQTDERTGRMVHMEDLEAVAQKFRQSFPGLPVHALENERQAPKSLRAEISRMGATGDVGGAFHEGQVYLFRSGLFGLAHAEEVAVHEATHGGLSRLFGDSIGPVMMDIHRSNAKVMDQALTLKKKYGYSTVRATEEVLADMGPTVTKLKGWERLVAWVRDKLRKFGLVKEWTDNDVQALVLKALSAVKSPIGSHIYRGTSFSVSSNEFRDSVKKIINDITEGKRVQSEPVHVLDSTPSAMQVFGWANIPVAIKPSEIDKIHFDHGVTAEKISSLIPETLQNPAAILASASQPGRLVFVADDQGQKPMLLVVSPEADTKLGKRQLIVSMYPKDEGWSWVGRQIRDGMLLYRNPESSVSKNFSSSVLEAQKKISQTGRPMTGLIPEIGAKQLGDGYKVLLPSDLRKWESERESEQRADSGVDENEKGKYGQLQEEAGNGPVRFSRSTQTPAQAGVSTSGEIIGDSSRDYTPEQRRAFGNTGRIVQHQTLKERVAAIWKDAGKKMAQGIVDQFAPVKDLSEKAYTLLRLSKGATGAFEAFMEHGKLSIRDGAYDADTSGGVMNKVFYPIGKESTDFLYWVAGNRAERLKTEGKEKLFTDEDIAAYKSLADGVTDFDYTMANGQVTRDRTKIYADTLKKFNEFNKNVLDMAEQSGLIDGESRHLWENEFYVPFYRTAPDDDGGVRGMNIKQGVVRQEAFKKLKGGTDGLNDLLSNTLMNWAHLIDAAAKNRAAEATLKAAETAGVARKAVSGEKKTVWHMGKITKEIPAGQEYEENGVTKVSDGTAKITYTGKVEYKVEDPYLLAALNGLEYAGLRGPAMDALSATKHWLTMGVTASPFFKVRNLIRDSIQAIGTAELDYNPLKNVKKGWELTDRESQEYVSALAGGGLIRFGTMLEGNESARTRQLIKKGNPEASILDSESKVRAFYDRYLEPALTAYNEIGNRGEEINRMALYDQLIKQGKDHATASLLARDLMDFSMQGAWTSIRFLTQVVPFMNARLQGLYKLGKSAKEDPQRFATVLGAVTLASLALLAMFHDDDDWKKREDWDRDNYWWFKFGGMAFRIPKPFEIGAIATLAERSAELAFDNEMTGKRFRDRLLAITSDQLSMNPIPQMVKPIMDVYANKDSFRGTPIETMGMEKLAPDYRFKQNTSMVARGISTAGQGVTQLVGQNFLSPVQVDHLIQGYFSWLGAFVVGGADMAVRSVSDQPTKPTIDYWKTATGGMASQLDGASSRYVSQMYEQAKELEQAYGTWRYLLKEGKGAEAQEYRLDHAEELSKYRQVERVKKAEARINERIRMIERSNLDADTKRERIIQVRKQQDQVARVLS